jgi:riboflavin kinase/FMN adenylyltransferase
MGNVLSLRRLGKLYGFRVHSIPPVRRKGRVVSSSLIRNFLEKGRILEANALLGRHYDIEGEVVRGAQRGKALGFPTANIRTENEILPRGVFLTEVEARGKIYPSLTNIGLRPTFHHKELNVESFLIDFSSDIYGERIKIKFLKKIRQEIRFSSPEALRRQIISDLETARNSFKGLSPRSANPAWEEHR